MSPRHHVVITGTGRAGTSFLVELLTHLGIETGLTPEDLKAKRLEQARAGFEHDIRLDDCPFVVKSPRFCEYAKDVVGRDDIVIEHVFVPIRHLGSAAESRRYVSRSSSKELAPHRRLTDIIRPKNVAGGLANTRSHRRGRQEKVLLKWIYELMFVLSDSHIPVTLIRYPRMVKDRQYLYEKLQPLLGTVEFETFAATFDEVLRPELLHSFNREDR